MTNAYVENLNITGSWDNGAWWEYWYWHTHIYLYIYMGLAKVAQAECWRPRFDPRGRRSLGEESSPLQCLPRNTMDGGTCWLQSLRLQVDYNWIKERRPHPCSQFGEYWAKSGIGKKLFNRDKGKITWNTDMHTQKFLWALIDLNLLVFRRHKGSQRQTREVWLYTLYIKQICKDLQLSGHLTQFYNNYVEKNLKNLYMCIYT